LRKKSHVHIYQIVKTDSRTITNHVVFTPEKDFEIVCGLIPLSPHVFFYFQAPESLIIVD